MDKTKLISIRIDEDTLLEIKKVVARHPYWKRNRIINSVLTSLFMNAKEQDIFSLITWWKHSDEKLEISVKASSV